MSEKIVNNSKRKVNSAYPSTIDNPELFFGIVGPIGVDIDSVVSNLRQSLMQVGYESVIVHLTNRLNVNVAPTSYFDRSETLIREGNAFREAAKDNRAMAALGITAIHEHRVNINKSPDKPVYGTAYIIRQFKRPEEIQLMREVYGRKFIQVSVHGSEAKRKEVLFSKIKSFNSAPKSDSHCEQQAIELIHKDYMQSDIEHGQSISDVFYLGDVFIDGVNKARIRETVERFISALFGDNRVSPSKDEYGLYMAAAAALRSIDLSRQVGASIFSENGEVISLGCNEVPKSKGGTYWSDDDGDKHRDMEVGYDPNHNRKNEIIFDIVQRLSNEGVLSRDVEKLKTIEDKVAKISSFKSVADSQLMDIIEYGRIIHAEMSAITDAARLGRSTKDATLYCTTFPCHICAKHIVSAGLRRVVFLEPYPKSHAKNLHSDSITFDDVDTDKVLFSPFIGISPRRYRDIFEKRKRKDKEGRATIWTKGKPIPMIDDRGSSYTDYEEEYVAVILHHFFKKRTRRNKSDSKS
ncbi:MAG: anti-phage dCTP deaminase [Phreatobacter sp.]|uniref:anti-phage dCTP deaminase n=1 Tax=Phreatobacter sp. TaxID=1966341 RepID=UPI0040361768